MSCGDPAADADALMQRRKKYDKTKICVKCKIAQGNLVIRHAVYCKECFISLIVHRFRRALEPAVNPKPDGPRRTALKPTGNLLVGFSGGLGSSVLLELVHRCYVALDKTTMPADGGSHHPRHERVWKKVTVCYVEVCDAFPGMKDRSDEIAQSVARYDDLEFVSLRIQDAFDPSWWERTGGKPYPPELGVTLGDEALLLGSLSSASPDPLTSLRAYLTSLPTPTAITSTIQTLTRLLLLHSALQTNSSHLVLGTSLTSLAVSLISGVAQGAGFNIREETQEDWTPDTVPTADPTHPRPTRKEKGKKATQVPGKRAVRIVRPLRDIGMKECAAWAWWAGVPIVGKEKWGWAGAKPGIGTLTKAFIVGLEKDYPSTVSTIVRTCGKLAPKGEVSGACILCGRPAQRGVQEWKARISIRSRPPPPSDGSPDAPAGPQADVEADALLPSLTPYLCYACHTTLTSRSARPVPSPWAAVAPSPVAPLPVWAEARLSSAAGGDEEIAHAHEEVMQTRRVGQDEMKDIVQEFLLDD
ncbi:uncharacterized protein TRAVEDRAFT_72547 [Trametes versicolor FP-101664 SS1]|uniref:uncharacterized protein n=1 Tax=Trametes versicolor (strain FP-101664) TaxID=717944 RepID=UPI0004623558|nr:uncharacterized protein TRAVEDRAFT_72547 [Trametes versicolor FP-101664 SS1]EIW57454.1 hypothetical protein TRAVEDRAFT_72547 [Trametes versicolor FP-101664 SS1]